MHHLALETTIPLLILVGIFSSILASMIGLGGGLVAIPFISLVIGFENNLQAKLIAYASVASLSLFAAFKYIRQKRKPDFKSAFFILLGTVPITILCEIFVSPKLSEVPKYVFTYCYGVIVACVIALINLKHLIPYKGIAPTWSLPIFGAIVGVLAGSFGLSGGVLFVPFLVIGLKMEPKQVAVNSLTLKLVTSLANVIAGFGDRQYQEFEDHGVFWWAPLAVIGGTVIGSQIGPIFNKKMTNKQVAIGFNIVLGSICIWEFTSATLMYEGVL